MRILKTGIALGLAALAGMGCSSVDKSAPPPRVAVPSADPPPVAIDRPDSKPLPRPDRRPDDFPAPPFDDVPLVNQRPPEQGAFVSAYDQVGKPRILVFVNRSLEGEVIPVNPDGPIATVEHRASASSGVSVESRSSRTDDSAWRDRTRDSSTKFQSNGPGEYRETTDIYLHPGQYDEVQAKVMDYQAMETILTDWLSADGKVAIVSPTMARQRLTEEQVKELQNGRPRMLGELARQLDADVLVQVQAHPTRQTERGLEVRIVAEAINVKGGESIARAVVDIPPPLDKLQLNKYTRFLARKLMDGMTGSWESFGGPAHGENAPPAGAPEPTTQKTPAP